MIERSGSIGNLLFMKLSKFSLIQNTYGGRTEFKKYNGANKRLTILKEFNFGQILWKQLMLLETKEF